MVRTFKYVIARNNFVISKTSYNRGYRRSKAGLSIIWAPGNKKNMGPIIICITY